MAEESFSDWWEQMRIESVLLRDHVTFYRVQSIQVVKANPFVDRFGPRVMYVKMTSLLDEALTMSLDQRGLQVVHPFRNDLHGRISCLDSHGILQKAAELHRVRGRRNKLAHERDALVSWDELERDTSVVHAELRHLGLVREEVALSTFAERDVDLKSGKPGVAAVHHYTLGVKSNGGPNAAIRWSTESYRLGWSPDKVAEALSRGEKVPVGLGHETVGGPERAEDESPSNGEESGK